MDYNKIIKEYSTPLFVYNINILKERIKYLRENLKGNLCYAIKANSFVIREITEEVERIEICSFGEYMICKNNNVPANKMVLSGVNKSYDEFNYIFENETDILRYTIESIHQFELLKELSEKYKRKINILPRITSGNQFGITYKELEYIIENLNEYMTLSGIEFFSGTQKHSIKRIEKEIKMLSEICLNIKEKYSVDIKEIEYGPGLPVYYFQNECFNEDEFLNEINIITSNYLKDKEIIFEIGRSMVASCGVYITSVVDKKENKTGKYVILDGGINHLVYYGGSMGMMAPYYEILSKNEKEEEIVNLFGSLCTINDIILKGAKVPKLNIGDTFIFKNVGAYSVTEGINLFLSRDMPKIILVNDGKCSLVRDKISTYKLNCPRYGGK